MYPPEFDEHLARSFEDRRLSRGERQALVARIAALGPDADLAAIRARAFEIARAACDGQDQRAVLDWLEGVVKALKDDAPPPQRTRAESHFSPGDDCPDAIVRLLKHARRSVDVCVFTITDDRLSEAILDALRRGVRIRVVTDNDKAGDLGSDVDRLHRAGVATRVDRTPFHMHHKFAIFDGSTLLNGSYNWTRGAARDNEENLIVTDDPRLVGRFAEVFEKLWEALS